MDRGQLKMVEIDENDIRTSSSYSIEEFNNDTEDIDLHNDDLT